MSSTRTKQVTLPAEMPSEALDGHRPEPPEGGPRWRELADLLRRDRRRLAIAVPIVAVIAVVLSIGVGHFLGRPPSVVVTTAAPATIDSEPGGVGLTSPAPGQSFAVSFRINGVTVAVPVESVDVIEGSTVGVGTPLFTLDPLPLEENLAEVTLGLSQARSTLAAAEAAAALSAPSTAAGAYLAVQVPTLKGDVAIDQELVKIAQGNGSTVTAPIAGTVTDLHVQPGQIARSGQTVLEIVRTGRLLVNAGIQLADLVHVRAGDSVDLSLAAVAGVHLTGTVLTVSPRASDNGLEGTVLISVPNNGPEKVPLQTQVFVHIFATVHAAVAVPVLAVFNLDFDPAVYVVSRGRVLRQPVVVGADDGNRVEIVSGLRAGQVVALSNTQTLVDGEAVRSKPLDG